jgi:hypothetical protein
MTLAFSPNWTSGVTLAVSTTTNNVPLSKAAGPSVVRIYNGGSATAFTRVTKAADGATTAVTTDLPIPAGIVECFTIAAGCDTVSAITSAGATTLYINQGEGM